MISADRRFVLTYNGEIFNDWELRSELETLGMTFRTRSDSEVVLQLYERYGPDSVNRLNGQWAFAIWDEREHTLFIARDRMGILPVFYTHTNRSFLFGSEIKSLLQAPETSREIDEVALDQICTFWHTIPPRTMFKSISELPPGCCLTLQDSKICINRYWTLNYAGAGASATEDADAIQRLRYLLQDATRIRLRGDVPVGAYVSGGLDSAITASMMRSASSGRLKTFSIRFDHGSFDEGVYQREVVDTVGSEHFELRCSTSDIALNLARTIWHTEQPLVRMAPVPLMLLSRLARAEGITVIITGEGADEIFGGYDLYKECKIRDFCSKQPDSKIRPKLLRRLYPYLRDLGRNSEFYLRSFFGARPLRADAMSTHWPRWSLGTKIKRVLSPAVRQTLADRDALKDLDAILPADYSRWDWMARAQFIETGLFLPGFILSSQGDRVAMANAVEGRFPFLDPRLVEFGNTLPATLKMKALCEKYLLKRSAAGLVPTSVISRPKQPYRAPDTSEVISALPREYLREILDTGRIVREGIFSPVAVQLLLRKHRSGAMMSAADNIALSIVISMQAFLDHFVNNGSEVN